jgi:hypothetical protein
MSSADASGALEAVDRILNRGGDADEVLREVVCALHERGGYDWAGIFLVEEGELVLGPQAGEPDDERRRVVPVLWQGTRVAELAVDGGRGGDEPLLERVAVLVSAHCLVGWDVDGEPWRS